MKHAISHHSVPRETFESIDALFKENKSQLNDYVDQLLWWNERINLVSRGVPRETIAEHIRHSLLLTSFSVFQNSGFIVDGGTGGGLPGIPLAIAEPGKRVLCNDIVSKKTIAVKQMVQKLGLPKVDTFDGSIAELNIDQPFLLASKHAFKINNLFNLTAHLPWKTMALYKGLGFEDELEGINIPLDISVYELHKNSENIFFKDKGIIIISR